MNSAEKALPMLPTTAPCGVCDEPCTEPGFKPSFLQPSSLE